MNDFIVWYSDENNQNMFSEEFTLEQLISRNHLDEISDSPLLKNFKVDSINNGIGLKDRNGKNIYADCSIVELDYSVGLWQYKKAIGVFFWDNERLKYRLNIIEKNNAYGKVIWNFEPRENKNFKIIDTIQENKLGLIK